MPAMRAQASAIYIGIITIVASLGPVIVSSMVLMFPEGLQLNSSSPMMYVM